MIVWFKLWYVGQKTGGGKNEKEKKEMQDKNMSTTQRVCLNSIYGGLMTRQQ